MTDRTIQSKVLNVTDPNHEWMDESGELTDHAFRVLWRKAAWAVVRKYKLGGLGTAREAYRNSSMEHPPREWASGKSLVAELRRY